MNILGINHDMIISSAALVVDGEIVAAVPEERLNRMKFYREFPSLAIDYCLKRGGLEITDIDYVTQCWNPGIHMEKFHPYASKHRHYRHEYLHSVPDYLLEFYNRPKVNFIEQKHLLETGEEMNILKKDPKIPMFKNVSTLTLRSTFGINALRFEKKHKR